MNGRVFRALVLTTTVAVLAMATISGADAASARQEECVSALGRAAGALPTTMSGASSGVPLFIGKGVAAAAGPWVVSSYEDFVREISTPSPSLLAAVYQYFAQGGLNAFVLPVATEDAPTFATALGSVTPVGPRPPAWDLIVIPALGSLSPTDWLTTAAHMTATASAAQATALLDPPDVTVALSQSGDAGPLTELAQQLRGAVASPANAVLLSSDLIGFVAPVSMQQPTAVSGAAVMAGIIAATDIAIGVWAAPGGPTQTVLGLQPRLTVDDALESALTSPASIDAWRVFPGSGTILSGTLTLAGQGFDKWLTRQRTVSWISRSIELGLEGLAFAPNDASTWSAVGVSISSFLTPLWQQGGLVGSTAADAFNVTADLGGTMTAQDVADGLLKVKVDLNVSTLEPPVVLDFQQQVAPGS